MAKKVWRPRAVASAIILAFNYFAAIGSLALELGTKEKVYFLQI
jgi:hypothetical protein